MDDRYALRIRHDKVCDKTRDKRCIDNLPGDDCMRASLKSLDGGTYHRVLRCLCGIILSLQTIVLSWFISNRRNGKTVDVFRRQRASRSIGKAGAQSVSAETDLPV
ncbi:hypothetical protein [Paraburkholderia caballeronis]|uniref:hypothetical protein n=1 Tax=Paraburkholderia caballeronis TaxID=416943 RepID=UPI00106592C1|nr:hypothetical protein [Paraburkholderia caballeronis]